MKQLRYILCVLCVSSVLLTTQQAEAQTQVDQLLAEMTPAERIGQLFVITFFGTDVSPESDIATLIRDYHIGGVMLDPANNNFPDEENLALSINTLNRDLQTLNRQLDDTTQELPNTIPLFIAADLGHPAWYDLTQVSPSLTPLPSNMSIGATWQPELARSVGQVAGQELNALGVNLVLGPVADVVQAPSPDPLGDQGTMVFGGSPYWVGEMTAAYVDGLHQGADGRLLVAPRHFPGYGSADRLAEVEIPNVRRDLSQLQQTELVPFYRVTTGINTESEQADALVTGHISYRGLQGDSGSRPVSLDPNALQTLIAEVEPWHSTGGLLISDALGLRGIQRLYNFEAGTPFPNRAIALDAFEAGNDVLYLGNFGANPPADQTIIIIDTLEYFISRYQQDVEFRERTDEAVRRILQTKVDLYDGAFTQSQVGPSPLPAEGLEPQPEVAANVANAALTLLSPSSSEELQTPAPGDRIVIFSDIRSFSQCSTCTARSLIGAGELQASILRLYGPEGSNIVSFADVTSHTFDELSDFIRFGTEVEGPATEEISTVGVSLDNADWVILLFTDTHSATYPAASVVSEFLAAVPNITDANLIGIGSGAPYYLDATEASKLTAYYGLYDTSSPFIDAAATALFRQVPFNGDSPITVASLGYNIDNVTMPAPNQIIQLRYTFNPDQPFEAPDATPDPLNTPTPLPTIAVGEEIFVRAVDLRDRNGRLVPDGTEVTFIINYVADGERDFQIAQTVDGVAQMTWVRDRDSLIIITAESPPADNSFGLSMDASNVNIFTPQPTQDLQPTLAPTATEPPPEATDEAETQPLTERMVDFGDLFFMMLGLSVLATTAFTLTMLRQDLNTALLIVLPMLIIGIVAYNYYALQLPGALGWRRWFQATLNAAGTAGGMAAASQWAAGAAAWIAALFTFGIIRGALSIMTGQWQLWRRNSNNRRKDRNEDGN